MPHARPFLHFLELTSRAGIFFEAHESIRKHVAISTLLINAFAASEEEEVLSLSLDESSLLDSLHALDVRSRQVSAPNVSKCTSTFGTLSIY